MKNKLSRRELVQAGVLTGAALALGTSAAPQAGPAESEGIATIQSVNYGHVPDYCDSSWKNPACAGNPSYWQNCSPHPSIGGQSQSCGHSA
jgi:hypothetical protein